MIVGEGVLVLARNYNFYAVNLDESKAHSALAGYNTALFSYVSPSFLLHHSIQFFKDPGIDTFHYE